MYLKELTTYGKKDTHIDPNQQANVRIFILKRNRLRNVEKDNIKEQIVAYNPQNKTIIKK